MIISTEMTSTMIQSFRKHEDMILVDSNILIYAINTSSPKSSEARRFLQSHRSTLCIAQQNILETLRVITHNNFPNPMKIDQALKVVLDIVSNFPIITPSADTLAVFLELSQKYNFTGKMLFDVYLVATALGDGIRTIATDNEKDFRKFEQIEVLNPFR